MPIHRSLALIALLLWAVSGTAEESSSDQPVADEQAPVIPAEADNAEDGPDPGPDRAEGRSPSESAAATDKPMGDTQDDDGPRQVRLELNKLSALDDACRAYVVARNQTEADFDQLRADVVMFDADGIVNKRLAVDLAPLPAGKTSLKVFDIGGLACDDIGQMLLNQILDCRDADGDRENCLADISVRARGPVPFIK